MKINQHIKYSKKKCQTMNSIKFIQNVYINDVSTKKARKNIAKTMKIV